jgi:4'-phosphopantetheinyl transferase
MVDSSIVWKQARADYVLGQDQVHVWRANLDQSPACIVTLRGTLSADEQERADQFNFEADRVRFVIGRGVSRSLLGHCLGVPAESIGFEFNDEGKPSLATELGDLSPNFNISHSGDFVLVALAYGRELGVDVERIRRDFDPDAIAERFFSQNERSRLSGLPSQIKYEAFFSCWTKKEAYLKARGAGLSSALDTFDVAFLPGEIPRLIETRGDLDEIHRWTLLELDLGLDYKAALAVEGADHVELATWDWSGWPLHPD